jgi:transcriptional regulator with XRE-family HTH domain
MRLRCFMRELRGERSITEASQATGCARGEISMFERGHSLPHADQVPRLTRFYGVGPDGWYPRGVLGVLYPDIARCEGCGEELAPGASRRRRFHDDVCRRLRERP